MEEARNEEAYVKKLIRRKIMAGNDLCAKYLEYCNRIHLCSRVIAEELAFGQLDTLSEWFNPKNLNGYLVSGILYILYKIPDTR